MWKVNHQWIGEEITREVRKYFEINERENSIYQNVCGPPIPGNLKNQYIHQNLNRRKISYQFPKNWCLN